MKKTIENLAHKLIGFLKKFLPEEEKGTIYETRNGITVIVSDELPPEANAMSLAMYSRDPRSFLVHLAHVLKQGWKKFLSQYYVGYGHKSIGDCGSTTICIEGVSMLCAKAIQQYLLYKGQEASTRYLNMLQQLILNFLGKEGDGIQKEWMRIYEWVLSIMVPHLKQRFPLEPGQKTSVWERAINAKAFDVARAFLPAGTTTFVGWHTTLREARDHLVELRNHPLVEVREVAKRIGEMLHKKYPSSGFDKTYPATEAYVASYMSSSAYTREAPDNLFWVDRNFDYKRLFISYKRELTERPEKTELPSYIRECGTIKVSFLLDFGSFRDLQRHRSVTLPMPLLTVEHGFHPWYIAQIPEEHRAKLLALIEDQVKRIDQLPDNEYLKQYNIAMGFQVTCKITGSLPALVYIIELRSGKTVHPTLRVIAQRMGEELRKRVLFIKLYDDQDPDEWDIKRGNQTIIKKET